MIVPFLFGIEKNPIHYLWIFYKYMEFALENDYPIIAEEAYFEKPSVYKKQKEYPFLNTEGNYNVIHEFRIPDDDDMDKLKKYPITKLEKNKVICCYKTEEEFYKEILIKENKFFEEMISNKINQIEKDIGHISAIITWTWYKSLENVCQEKNITLILLEQTTFRPVTYREKFGYFQFYDKYDATKNDNDYFKFLADNKGENDYFSRQELLAMFLSKEKLRYMYHLYSLPKYEFGVNIGPDHDPLQEANCHKKDEDILRQVNKLASKEKISLRIHPMRKNKDEYKDEYNIDSSASSLEWILKNRRIVSIGSNLAFEAMLLGRTSYILGDNFPYLYGGVSSLNYIDDKICDIEYLNYLIFGYYVPYQLMFDKDYIKWRLEKPSITEIYNYNLEFVLKKMNLSKDIFKLSPNERVTKILKESQKLTLEEYKALERQQPKNLKKEIKDLESQLEQEKRQISELLNSRSWKLTKPLRFISKKIHR